MRTVVLGNRRLAVEVARFLAGRGELAGAVVHRPEARDAVSELFDLGVPVWTWPDGLEKITALRPECLMSVLFGHKLSPAWLAAPSWGAINVHPGLLPFNRGKAPFAWPLVDGTPAGTTLHLMDESLDTGPVLAQRHVPVYGEDTAETLFRRLEAASLAMITTVWPHIRTVVPKPQVGEGTEHRAADLASLDLRDEHLEALDRLRARTFATAGAEFVRDGRRYRARVQIERLPD